MSDQETKICQNCKQSFVIAAEDFAFYEKIRVPAPTRCPECRQFRRYAWRNERTLYRRNCDLCGKSTVTIYSPSKPYKVYCPPCFWGDGWDAGTYARDFDFSRPFFEQWRELHVAVPRIALLTKNSVNSEYANHCGNNKDCYLVFATFNSENVLYSTRVLAGKECVDCLSLNLLGKGASELCYECINSERCYNCQHGYLLRDCRDCTLCFNCRGCSDCVLSWNLRNKKYCIENVEYDREEYLRKVKEMELETFSGRERAKEKFREMVIGRALHRAAIFEQAVNSTGNFLSYTKNTLDSFNAENVENARFIINGSLGMKDCMDCYNFGIQCELVYESHAVVGGYSNLFCHLCYDNSSITYCDDCHNSDNLFGCVGMKKGSYGILNKQYPKEEYEELKERIVFYMKQSGEYGEFFPAELSPFGYNETQGAVHRPMPKKEILARGLKWEDELPGTYGRATMPAGEIPETTKGTPDGITGEVLECIACTKNYNVVPVELALYRRMNVPVPRRCPDCRYRERIAARTPRRLWHRSCMCDKGAHGHAGKCPNEFETSYAPDRKEIVYCEQCYNAEVV